MSEKMLGWLSKYPLAAVNLPGLCARANVAMCDKTPSPHGGAVKSLSTLIPIHLMRAVLFTCRTAGFLTSVDFRAEAYCDKKVCEVRTSPE